MAIFRIFPEKDATIYSEIPTSNTGKDEILEVGGYNDPSGTGRTARTLTQFSTNDIKNTIDSKIGNNSFKSYLKLYLAEAGELPVDFKVYSYPVYESWENGIGKYGDIPVDTSGVSWAYRSSNSTNSWTISNFPVNVTGSFIDSQLGGGSWLTGSNGSNLEASQSFSINSDKDLQIDVTPTVLLFYSESISNNGFLIKLEDQYEFQTTSSIRLKYFGGDTNTIYPPYLEFRWDDSTYDTGSLSVLSTSTSNIIVKNNKGKYIDEGKQRFRLAAKPTYPTRTFTTSSIYLTSYALPVNSYWALKDEHSEEMIVNFDTEYTKISCDSNGPYFDVYMDGLEPERYYRILIKTELDGSTTVVDDKNIFKIIRNG